PTFANCPLILQPPVNSSSLSFLTLRHIRRYRGPRSRGIRRGGAAVPGEEARPSGWLSAALDGAVRIHATRSRTPDRGCSSDSAADRPAALHEHAFPGEDAPHPSGGTLLRNRRVLVPVPDGIPPERSGMDGPDRAARRRRRDRHLHAALSGPGIPARVARWPPG